MIKLFLFLGLIISAPTFALECKHAIMDEIENIGLVTVPENLPVGARLWTSKEMVRDVRCTGESGVDEWVYFYGNPDKAPFRPGINMGIIYNGKDLGTAVNGMKEKTHLYVKGRQTTVGAITFQIYLEKSGKIGNPTPYNSIAVFQLDGVGGINNKPGVNYRYSAGGINNIKLTNCSVELSFPKEIDFGYMYWENIGEVVDFKKFTIRANKSPECRATDKLGVELMFSPIGATENSDFHLSMGNGSVFRLIDDSGDKVKFKNPVRFWDDVSQGSFHERAYRAEIYSTGAPKSGSYSQSIVLYLNYF